MNILKKRKYDFVAIILATLLTFLLFKYNLVEHLYRYFVVIFLGFYALGYFAGQKK